MQRKGKQKLEGEYHGNFSWAMDGKIAGADMPGRFSSLESDLEWFFRQGVRVIVTLTESPLPAKSVGRFEYLHMPIKDMGSPDYREILKFVSFADRMIAKKKPVLVHCNAGIGRTGTMLACFLVSNGFKAAEALDIVKRKRGYGLFTEDQYSAVYQFESILKMNESRKKGELDG